MIIPDSADINKLPNLIIYLYAKSVTNGPVSMKLYEEALEKHPEFVPVEIANRKKGKAMPEEVHDSYYAEKEAVRKDCFANLPEVGGGLLAWAEGTEDFKKWHEEYVISDKKYKPLEKEIHQKYYKKYGIKHKESWR